MGSLLKCQALILKVASRCNLNCTYCYMYNLGDTTFRSQPKFMSGEVVSAVLHKVRAHCRAHGIRQFHFIFHGGEPLLCSRRFYRAFVTRARQLLLPDTKPVFSLQTNGVLLDGAWCRVLGELGIRVGISLDGLPEENDRRRVDHQGRGSYEAAVRGLRIAQRSPYLAQPPALLTVIDVGADPLATYRHLKGLGVSSITFLLPYGTHDQLPPGLLPGREDTPYADWLIPVFDEWFEAPPPKPRIRLFEQILELVVGIDRGYEYFGAQKLEFLVVETDGSLEAAGALKVCGNGFTKAGVNIRTSHLDEALQTDLARLYHLSHHHLPAACRQCPLVPVCGGGFLPHRYSKSRGFDNPSVYCLDLMKLITHVQNKLLRALPASLTDGEAWTPLSFEWVKTARRNHQQTLIQPVP